jgi:hypothetical protein
MDIRSCQQKLSVQYEKNVSQIDNVSKLTSSAWGRDKLSCLQQMGGTTQVKTFLLTPKKYQSPVIPQTWQSVTHTKQVSEKTSSTSMKDLSSFFSTAQSYLIDAFW